MGRPRTQRLPSLTSLARDDELTELTTGNLIETPPPSTTSTSYTSQAALELDYSRATTTIASPQPHAVCLVSSPEEG
jgi:hypothetical protein